MNEINNYTWHDDEADINKPKSHKKRTSLLMSIMAVSMVICIGITAFVVTNEHPRSNINGSVFKSDKNTSFNFNQLTSGERVPKATVDIAEEVGPSVVGINCKMEYTTFFGQTVEQGGSGSGIIISSDGYIVTNNHVVEGAKSVSVVLNTGKEYPATLVGTDPKTDLAVVKINQNNLIVATLGDSDESKVGELAIAIGNPLGQELAGTVTVGVVSAVNRSITLENNNKMTLIQTDASINPGNSGGALVNTYGEIIGINSMKFSGDNVEGIGFAIPINIAKPIISDLISVGYVKGRPLIGMTIREISPDIAAINDLPAGLQIIDLTEGGAAAQAGLQKGDVILSVNDKIGESVKEINELKDAQNAGDTLKIEVSRDGTNMKFDVILQEDTSSAVPKS